MFIITKIVTDKRRLVKYKSYAVEVILSEERAKNL